jgi:hypothetical protein
MSATANRTVTCSCKVCKINAEKVGASFPLTATVPAAHLDGRKVDKALRHSLVTDAHNPGALGKAMRLRIGLLPA